MNLRELGIMKEIGSIGTSHAATTLSKLLSEGIRITFPEANVLECEETVSRIGNPEEIIAAVLVKMGGDVEGLMLFLFNLEFVNTVLDKLMEGSFSDFTELDEISHSALVEAGNVIICSYINAFSQLVGAEVGLSAPSTTVNMLGGVLTVPITEYGCEIDKLVHFNADFVTEEKKLPGWLLILPDIDSPSGILGKSRVL